MGNNEKVLMSIPELDEDSVEDILDMFAKLELGDIAEAEELPAQYGRVLRIKNTGGREFYVGLGELGYLDIIREGSPTGDIVFAFVDD